jgi:hypothetical protein
MNRFSDELEPVNEAPPLFTFNSLGFKLYGKSDFDAETKSFMTTHYFVVLYLPLFPVARYRVVTEDGTRYWFLGKGKLRGFDRLHVALFAGLVTGLIAMVGLS